MTHFAFTFDKDFLALSSYDTTESLIIGFVKTQRTRNLEYTNTLKQILIRYIDLPLHIIRIIYRYIITEDDIQIQSAIEISHFVDYHPDCVEYNQYPHHPVSYLDYHQQIIPYHTNQETDIILNDDIVSFGWTNGRLETVTESDLH